MKKPLLLIMICVLCGCDNKQVNAILEGDDSAYSSSAHYGYVGIYSQDTGSKPPNKTKVFAKRKEQKQPERKYRDSTSYYTECDTIFGIIEYKEDGGTIRGNGMLVKGIHWTRYHRIPLFPPDTTLKATSDAGMFFPDRESGDMGWGAHFTNAFIKMNNGHHRVYSDYLFIPD